MVLTQISRSRFKQSKILSHISTFCIFLGDFGVFWGTTSFSELMKFMEAENLFEDLMFCFKIRL